MTIIQRHTFVSSSTDHPDKCTGRDDNSDTICFRKKIHHTPYPISTEINPYHQKARGEIVRTMRKDIDVAMGFVRQYKAWEADRSLSVNNRKQHREHRQLWEARVYALTEALSGLERYPVDD